MSTMSGQLRAERERLVADLEHLSAQQWATPSLCEAWTVQQVAAHLAWAPAAMPHEVLVGFLRARLRPNDFITDSARRWAGRGVPAILEQLRVNAGTGARPIGLPQVAALGDAVVHGLDVRRPLGISQAISADVFVPVAEFFVGARWPVTVPLGGAGRHRFAGVRLVATDVGWSHGSGPEVRRDAAGMLLLLTGRERGPAA